MFGLMSVFGNGVVEGWTISQSATFAVEISKGFGNINFRAGRSNFPFTIDNLPPNSISYVYVRQRTRTTFSEDIEFVLDTIPDITDPNFLLLAKVIVGAASIESIDNSVRQEIGFLELIKAAIRIHKHRGGSLNPSKIDLESEVKGQLASFRIADFDADKITTGTFDLSRMPLLDHQDLQNVGLLTHPQLDTFVKTLELSNKEIFGNIGTANLLQFIIAVKLIYEDPDSILFIDRIVDENFINEFALIPGITPNSFIDFDNTTAIIDLEQHRIKGIPPTTGTSFFVRFDTDLAWNSAHSLENLTVSSNTVTLAFNNADETNIQSIEGFETATEPDQKLTDEVGGIGLFAKQTIITVDNATILSHSNATNVFEGFYSGKFSHQQTIRSQYVKTFETAQDWSSFDSFVLHVKCLDIIHGPVKMFFTASDGENSADFTLLDQDEITDNVDPLANGFEIRVIDIATISFRTSVRSFTIFTDDTVNPFSFFIDDINIQRAVLLPEEGTLKLRYAAGAQVTFVSIEWDSTEPAGTQIDVRARSASGTVFLTRATYTPLLSSGEVVNLQGTDLEIEITFTPDADRVSAPILNSVRVLILTEAEIDGFSIDTKSEFIRGHTKNITISSDPSLVLSQIIYVKSFYFNLANFTEQLVQSPDRDFNDAELAFFGTDSPIAPNQIFKTIEDEELTTSTSKFFEPRSVRRAFDRNFVIADTYNDRVLEYDESGTLVRGVGSINYEHSSALVFPIAASIDISTGILYIVWSKRISFKTINLSKITIQTTTQKVQLIEDFDLILNVTKAELENINAEGQIMPVYLSAQNAGLVQNLSSTKTFLFLDNEAVQGGIENESVFYQTILTGLGIPCYVGKFAYIDGIFTPTWAEKQDDGSYIIGNATIAVKEYVFPDTVTESITLNSNVSNIIQVDKKNNIVFGSNIMAFSPFVPGRIQPISKTLWLIGGIRPNGEEGIPDTDKPFDFRGLSGDDEVKKIQKSALKEILFGSTNPFVGSVIILDRISGSILFQYVTAEGVVVSDVDIDSQGQYVVAESSLDRSGRIIKLDTSGNIVFSYGEGLYNLINDVSVQNDDSMFVST